MIFDESMIKLMSFCVAMIICLIVVYEL